MIDLAMLTIVFIYDYEKLYSLKNIFLLSCLNLLQKEMEKMANERKIWLTCLF